MKCISKIDFLVIVFLFFGTVIFTFPTSLRAIPVYDMEGLPEPGEMVLTSEKDIPRHVWVAGQYLKTGKFKNVISICEQVLKMKQNHIEARARMAAAYKGLGEEEKFKKEAEHIKKQAPGSPALYLSLAQVYLSLKDFKNAENSYKKGLKTASEKTELLMGLGALYAERGRLKEASDQYKRVLKKKGLATKHFLNANFALCRIGLQKKEYDGVIKRAKMVTDLYPPIPQGYMFLGEAHVRKGEAEQAIKVYEKLMEVNPQSAVSYQELALIYTDKIKNYNKALGYALQAVKKSPKDAKSQDVLGWVYYKKGKYRKAVNRFENATSLAQGNPTYHYHLGLAKQKMDDKAGAKEVFEQAIGLLGSNESNEFTRELKSRIEQCD